MVLSTQISAPSPLLTEFLKDIGVPDHNLGHIVAHLLEAARTEQDAFHNLLQAIEPCTDRFRGRPRQELEKIASETPGSLALERLEFLEAGVRSIEIGIHELNEERRREGEELSSWLKTEEAQGASESERADRVQAVRIRIHSIEGGLDLLHAQKGPLRQELQTGTAPLRAAAERDWKEDLLWLRRQISASPDLLHPDARARHVACRLLLGLDARPRSLKELRALLTAIPPRLGAEATAAVGMARALEELDRRAVDATVEVEGDRPVGGYLIPGSSAGRWKWVHRLLAHVSEPDTDIRRARHAVTAIGAILAMDASDCLRQARPENEARAVVNALADLGISGPSIRSLAALTKTGPDPEQALEMVTTLAGAARKPARGKTIKASAPVGSTTLDFIADTERLRLGDEPLRYGKGKGRPISLGNATGHLLMWRVLGGQEPEVTPTDMSNLRTALKGAGVALPRRGLSFTTRLQVTGRLRDACRGQWPNIGHWTTQ